MGILQSKGFRMDKRVYLVFALVAAIAIANAILSTLKIRNNKNTIHEITEFSNPSMENLEEFNLLVTRSRMFISNWVYLPNNTTDKENLVYLNEVMYPMLRNRLTGLAAGWKKKSNPAQLEKLFFDYEAIIHEQGKIMSSLVGFDDYQDPYKKFLAEEQLEGEIIPATNRMMVHLRELIAEKKSEAQIMQEAMVKDNLHLLLIVFTLAILVIVSVTGAGIYLMRQVIGPLVHVRSVLLSMSAGELPEVTPDSRRSALTEMKDALVQLRDGLSRTTLFAHEIGRSNFNAEFHPLSEKDVLGSALLEMRDKLRHASEEDAQRNWAREGYTRISAILHHQTDNIVQLTGELISEIVPYVQAQQGAVYLVNDPVSEATFIEAVSFFAPSRDMLRETRFAIGEGIVGKVIQTKQKIHLNRVGNSSLIIDSKTSSVVISDICVLPLFAGGQVIGALEIRSTHELNTETKAFLDQIAEPIAANIMNLRASLLTRKLLDESQQKTRELAEQDEELRMINNELMRQSGMLKQSELELMRQQEALRKVNSELEQKAMLLEEKNQAIEDAHKAIAMKAEQLEKSNKYKSDFLANMSHELRTPLNSVLILAKLLSENKPGNMDPRQVEHARVIHKSGSDLLVIINDILDLSKIEAGKLTLVNENTSVAEMVDNMDKLFTEVSREKNIRFTVLNNSCINQNLHTDRVRVEQILKNLLSNAFKFTPAQGEVTLEFRCGNPDRIFRTSQLNATEELYCFRVSDTGIGIPADKQQFIFDAFNQADSSITRKYGGTGLGLAICTQLASMLGGEITLESEEGKGASFSLFLPVTSPIVPVPSEPATPASTFSRNLRVLVYAPQPDTETGWGAGFTNHKMEVVTWSGTEPLHDSGTFDAVVMDAVLSSDECITRVQFFRTCAATIHAAILYKTTVIHLPAPVAGEIALLTDRPVSPELIVTAIERNKSIRKSGPVPVPVVAPGVAAYSLSGNQQQQRLSGKTILIADDDVRNIYSLTIILEQEGANVLCAMNGNEVIALLSTHPMTDIILMDLLMPEKDGLASIREIREQESMRLMPIIAMSVQVQNSERERSLESGANGYLVKPLDPELLVNTVLEQTEKSSAHTKKSKT